MRENGLHFLPFRAIEAIEEKKRLNFFSGPFLVLNGWIEFIYIPEINECDTFRDTHKHFFKFPKLRTYPRFISIF
jgi:hypothetical protein